MNTQKLYSEAIGRKPKVEEEKPEQSPAEDATRFQIRLSWLESTVTQQMFTSLSHLANDLEKQARDLAMQFPEQEPAKAVRILIQAETIRRIIKTYASTT